MTPPRHLMVVRFVRLTLMALILWLSAHSTSAAPVVVTVTGAVQGRIVAVNGEIVRIPDRTPIVVSFVWDSATAGWCDVNPVGVFPLAGIVNFMGYAYTASGGIERGAPFNTNCSADYNHWVFRLFVQEPIAQLRPKAMLLVDPIPSSLTLLFTWATEHPTPKGAVPRMPDDPFFVDLQISGESPAFELFAIGAATATASTTQDPRPSERRPRESRRR